MKKPVHHPSMKKTQNLQKVVVQSYATSSGRNSTGKFLTQQINAALAATANSSMSEVKGKPQAPPMTI